MEILQKVDLLMTSYKNYLNYSNSFLHYVSSSYPLALVSEFNALENCDQSPKPTPPWGCASLWSDCDDVIFASFPHGKVDLKSSLCVATIAFLHNLSQR